MYGLKIDKQKLILNRDSCVTESITERVFRAPGPRTKYFERFLIV